MKTRRASRSGNFGKNRDARNVSVVNVRNSTSEFFLLNVFEFVPRSHWSNFPFAVPQFRSQYN